MDSWRRASPFFTASSEIGPGAWVVHVEGWLKLAHKHSFSELDVAMTFVPSAPLRVSSSLALVVARTDWNAQAIETIVEREFVTLRAASAHQAVQLARSVQPDVVLVYGELDDLPIPDVCMALAETNLPPSTAIVVIAPNDLNSERRETILRAGAWEVLGQDTEPSALLIQLRRFLAARREVVALQERVQMEARTGMYNHSGLMHRAAEVGAYASRHRTALSMVVMQPVVDTDAEVWTSAPVAHAPLDEHLARVVVAHARASDVVGWTGRRELALVALGTDTPGALSFVHRVRRSLRSEPLVIGGEIRFLSVLATVCGLTDFSLASIAAPNLLQRTADVSRATIPQPADSVRVLDDIPLRTP